MKANRTEHRVARLCKALGVSTSGFYAWLVREPSAHERRDEELAAKIVTIHRASRETYGRPRVHVELREVYGERVGGKRVARLMRQNGLEGASRRRKCHTTKRGKDARPAPDLVEREFSAAGPNKLWVADITYIPTWAGFCTCRSSLTSGAVEWSDGRWPRTCGRR